MIEVIKSATFDRWLRRLKDRRAQMRIQARIDRCAAGNPGDAKTLRDGLSELRIDYGPGYRIYFIRQAGRVIVLLAGGDKSSQGRDIKYALEIAREWEELDDGRDIQPLG